MYGQIIGKKGRTLEHIKDRSGLHHIYMDINNGLVSVDLDNKNMKSNFEDTVCLLAIKNRLNAVKR